jgi:hypothetical protein
MSDKPKRTAADYSREVRELEAQLKRLRTDELWPELRTMILLRDLRVVLISTDFLKVEEGKK